MGFSPGKDLPVKRYLEIAIIVVVIAVLAVLMRNKHLGGPQWQPEAAEVLRPLCGTDDVEVKVAGEEATSSTTRGSKVVVRVRRHASRPLVAWISQSLGFVKQQYGDRSGLSLSVVDWDSGAEMRDADIRSPQQGFESEQMGRLSNLAQRQLESAHIPGLVLVQCEAGPSPSGYIDYPRQTLSSRKRAYPSAVAERAYPTDSVPSAVARRPGLDGGARADQARIRRAPQFAIRKLTAFVVLGQADGDSADKAATIAKGALGINESRGDTLMVVKLHGGAPAR